MTQPLLDLAHKHPIQMNDSVIWIEEATVAFKHLQSAIACAPCLGNPDYAKLFRLYVHEKNVFMSGVLTQFHKWKPVTYYSKCLDPVMQGSLYKISGSHHNILCASDLVAMHELETHVPDYVHKIITSARTMHLSNVWLISIAVHMLCDQHW